MEGCTEKLAPNYDPQATIDDGSCMAQKLCIENAKGECENCLHNQLWGPCSDGNNGFKHPQYDTIYASRVKEHFLKIDGDLSEWRHVPTDLRYSDVPFANETGHVVIYQKSGGKKGEYYGKLDFSSTAMLAWDSTGLFMAVDVIDDELQTSNTCYKNGLQVAFEVGGERSMDQGGESLKGRLQAKRSDALEISNLILLNVGLREGQTECQTTRFEENVEQGCCIHYEHSGNGWSHLIRAGITRDEETKHTKYEVSFDKYDLLGNDPSHVSQWGENLRFGFSYLVNDGDEKPNQSGWGGYYPSSIVNGPYNGGNKEPWKAGVLQLHQDKWQDYSPDRNSKSFSWMGMFSIVILFTCLGFGIFNLIRRIRATSGMEDWRVWHSENHQKQEVLLRDMDNQRSGEDF